MLREIFGPERGEVTGEWRKLHGEELQGLYCLPNVIWVKQSRRMRWVEHVARTGEKGNSRRDLMDKSDVKRPFGRTRHCWRVRLKFILSK
jgi:hypothetical protein